MTSSSSRDDLRLPLLPDGLSSFSSSSSAAGVPTLTTPTLTPTTLRNIEQMFLDTDPHASDQHEHAARFEPPTVALENSHASSPFAIPSSTANGLLLTPVVSVKEEMSHHHTVPTWILDGSVLPGPGSNDAHHLHHVIQSASELPPPPPNPVDLSDTLAVVSTASIHDLIQLPTVPLHLLPTEPVPCSAVKSHLNMNNNDQVIMVPSTASMSIVAAPHNLTINNGPASPLSDPSSSNGASSMFYDHPTSNASPHQENKKLLRRLRNKEAAARCRKRRLDQTVSLQEDVEEWQAKNALIQNEIKSLEAQKQELESIMLAHRAECKADVATKKSQGKPVNGRKTSGMAKGSKS